MLRRSERAGWGNRVIPTLVEELGDQWKGFAMTADVGGPGAPRFDVVLRGYDRRQVDEHVGRLQRVVARMRADLEAARSQPLPVVPPPAGFGQGGPLPPGARQRPTPRPRA